MLTILKYLPERKCKKILIVIIPIALLIVIAFSTTRKLSRNSFENKWDQNDSKTILKQQDDPKSTANPTVSLDPSTTSMLTPSPTSSLTLDTASQNNDPTPTYTATKQNFSPNFSVSVNNPTPSAASEVNLEYGSNTGDWLGMGIKIVIPSGWEITAGTRLGQDMKIGEGVISAKLVGEPSSSRFVVYNQINTEGHKAKWLFKFDNETYGERVFFADGDKNQGHLLFLDGAVGIPFSSPVSGTLTIFSNIITNPSSSGIFEWEIQYLFADGILESKKEVAIK